MKVSLDVVRHVALLARLELTAEEEERFARELDAILRYVDQLRRLDTSDVPPTAHVFESEPTLREDRVANAPEVETLLANAPDRSADFFRVPKIIE